VTFEIIVTAESIQDDVRQFVASGQITQDEGNSLLKKLVSAAKARAKGNCANAATIYASFISEVQAQSGKKIDPVAASILIDDAQYLIAHCP
jgi:polyhydroxyalkanoate synthesis regulator phasin